MWMSVLSSELWETVATVSIPGSLVYAWRTIFDYASSSVHETNAKTIHPTKHREGTLREENNLDDIVTQAEWIGSSPPKSN